MIQVILSSNADPEKVEIRSSSVGSDTASKPPFIVHRDQLQATLLMLMRAAQPGVAHV
jgi:hypothetical protein